MSAIFYDDATHTYWNRTVRYTSATQVIEHFKPKFNTEKEAAAFAEKHGMTADYWKRKWKEINENSLDRGNTIHDLQDFITNHRSIDVMNDRALRVQNPELFPEEMELREFPDGIYTDNRKHVLYHHGYQIAGRPDKFALETIKGNRYMHIDDYKTNKRLRSQSFKFKDGSYQMMLSPLDRLMDCEMVHYTLQMSLYMLMGEYHGFKPGTMRIIHFPHKHEMAPPDASDPEPVIYTIPYMKAEVLKMVQHLKRKQNDHHYL